MRSAVLAIGLGWALAVPAAAERLDEIIDDYWQAYLDHHPISATHAGHREYNDRLPRVDPAALASWNEQEQAFLRRLQALDLVALSNAERINHQLLAWVLARSIAAYELDLARIPFNTFSGFYLSALNASRGVPMQTVADYEAYLSRLNQFPRYFEENIAHLQRGVETRFVLPRIVVEGVLPTIEAQVYDDPTQHASYRPFAALSHLPPAEADRIEAAGRAAVADAVIPAFERLAAFMRDTYLPAASQSLGATQLPDGERYYQHQIANYVTLTDLTAKQIHERGLTEVARIRGEMEALVAASDFVGTLEEFVTFLRTDPQFYAQTAEALIEYTAHVAKRIDHKMPGFFYQLPRLPYGVVPVPSEIAPNYTTAAYNPAPIGGMRGGEYWVNTHALNQRPLYELTALTLHEAVPGHHHQIALAQEMADVPAFRRGLYFSAFGEGWALYAEKLGVEMGVYRNEYEHFGRLSYEMWRACRLVIDTGIHAMGWERQQAIDYLANNTSLSAANIRAEVDRYISWPGQALSYKWGELKIWALRRQAEKALADDFDLRAFHDAVLANGALPMDLLDSEIRRWIDGQLVLSD